MEWRGGGVAKVVTNSTWCMGPGGYLLPRHIHACNTPKLPRAQPAAFPQQFRAPVFSRIADGTTAALTTCVFVQYSCAEKCKGEMYTYFKIHLSLRH